MAEKFVERSHGLILILIFNFLLCFELLIKYAWIVGYILLFLAFLLFTKIFSILSQLYFLVCCFQTTSDTQVIDLIYLVFIFLAISSLLLLDEREISVEYLQDLS